MAEPRIADDYAFIAARLKELESDKPGGKWAVWFEAIENPTWCHMRTDRTTYKVTPDNPITLFDSEAKAREAIANGTDSDSTRKRMIVKPYPNP